MWMPGGVHSISASRNGKPVRLKAKAEPKDALALQASLEEHLKGKQRPFFDFNHDGAEASAWPVRFYWDQTPEPGIYADVEWSTAGAAALTGKQYRAFSPKWYPTDDDPSGVDGAPLNMGGLTNDPAFREISPMWARNAADKPTSEEQTMSEKTSLTEVTAKLAELGDKEREIAQATEQLEEQRKAVEAQQAELAELKAKQELAAKETAERNADRLVAGAVARGAIAAKDTDTQGRWKSLLIADPNAADLIAKLPGSAALSAGRMTQPAGTRTIITAESSDDVLRGYMEAARSGDHREAGLIYSRNMAKWFADKSTEDPIARYFGSVSAKSSRGGIRTREAIEATNTLGTLAQALVSQRVLELVVSRRPQLNGITTDFSDELASKGDTIKTRTIGLPTVQDFGGTVSATADSDVTATLDSFKEVRYTFTAAEIVGTRRNLVAERAEALAVALGNSMVDATAALLTSAFTAKTTKATASVDFSTLVTINSTMNNAGVPDTYRFGWVSNAVAAAFRNDTLVMSYYDRGPFTGAYGHWTNLMGFADIWEYPALPANSQNLTGFFGSRSALVLAARVPRSPQELVNAPYAGTLVTVTDPVSGLSVVRNDWIAQDTWEVNARLVCLYGVARGQIAVGHCLVSA